ncbi:MAG: hypothetical protein JWO78_1637 [Micavibrio sp.]|nr:hypothetical protein [Micavibrio sp.]
MAPDSDVKDRIDRPGQNAVLDAGYLTFYSPPVAEDTETEDDEDGDGDGEGRASFAFDTPEPSLPAASGPETPPGKARAKGRKAKKGSKSALAARFSRMAGDIAASGASVALDVTVDKEMFAADDWTGIYQEGFGPAENGDTPTDLMNILFSAGERPWENEALSAAERMAMMKVLRTNFPDAQKRAEREEFEYRIRARSTGRTANVSAVVAAAAKTRTPPLAPVQKEKPQNVKLASAPAAEDALRLEIPSQPFIRGYGQPEESSAVDKNLKAALGFGSIVGMPSSLAMLNMTAKPQEKQKQSNYLGLAEIVAQQMLIEIPPVDEIVWNPEILSRDAGFVQALNRIYSALDPETLLNVTPYRQAMWAEKRQEQKENLADMTYQAPVSAIRAPAPSPFQDREVQINISIPAFR